MSGSSRNPGKTRPDSLAHPFFQADSWAHPFFQVDSWAHPFFEAGERCAAPIHEPFAGFGQHDR